MNSWPRRRYTGTVVATIDGGRNGITIAPVIWLLSSRSKRPGSDTTEKTALDILNERYARGEIGRDEFEQKKRDIGNDPGK